MGGETHILHTQAEALFRGLHDDSPISMLGQRIWYKLPYDTMKHLEILIYGAGSFARMCEASKWTKYIEIFMEHEDMNGDEEDEDVSDEEHNKEGEPVGQNDETEEDSIESGDREFEEDKRVEAAVGEIFDGEDNENYKNTPPCSDGEEEENPRRYQGWKRGSGELHIRQVFDSVKDFKDAVFEYALKGGWNIQFTRWGNVKSEAICGVEVEEGETPCSWIIYCSYEASVSQWMVKTFQDVHTCFKDARCKILSDSRIAKLFLNELREDPEMKPKAIQDQIQLRYDLNPSDDQCRNARKKGLNLIQAEYDEQFRRIKDYEVEIKR